MPPPPEKKQKTDKTFALAWDLEAFGPSPQWHDLIAIGAALMDEEYKVLDTFFRPLFAPGISRAEEITYEEFWKGKPQNWKNLNGPFKLKDVTSRSQYEEITVEALKGLLDFMYGHYTEKKKDHPNCMFLRCSDCLSFDGGFIDCLVAMHKLPDEEYRMLNWIRKGDEEWKFRPPVDVTSMERGMSFVLDKDFDDESGWTDQLLKLYDVPPSPAKHDHHPVNDSISIAWEAMAMCNIRRGKVQLTPYGASLASAAVTRYLEVRAG